MGLSRLGIRASAFVNLINSHCRAIKRYTTRRENGKRMTLRKLQTTTSGTLPQLEQLTLFAEDSHVRRSALQVKDEESLILVELFSLKLQDLFQLLDLGTLSARMLKVFCHMTKGELSPQSYPRFQSWGITSNGRFLTAKISASHKTGSAYSLSDILEQQVDEQYFLSQEQTEKILANCRK